LDRDFSFMINAGVTKATKNHEVHNAFLFVIVVQT